jgi:hypothetical protein
MVQYKQKCKRCPNFVLVTSRGQWPVCYDCQKKEMSGEIKDPKMKKLFAIPDEFYRGNSFLRSIKVYYLRFGKLSDKQLEAFKKTVKELKGGSKEK